jgi:hypothetical protein
MTTDQRLASIHKTLGAIEVTAPELVATGDISQSDADKIQNAVDKAQKAIETAQKLLKDGININIADEYEMAIGTLRIAQNTVASEQARITIGRTIAALTLAKAMH